MERLTERDEYGNADIIALGDMMPKLYAELSFSESNALTDALNRLAAYEDTGLSTDEVTEVVRCKDCKHFHPCIKPVEDFEGWCIARECETDEPEYCSYGERKDDEP